MEISVAELYEIAFNAAATADQSIEFWIWITFAVAIVSYTTSGRLTMPIRVFVGTLYLILSVCMYMRFVDAALIFKGSFEAINVLQADWESQLPVPLRTPFIGTLFLNKVVMALGTVGVMLVLFKPSLLKRKITPHAES